MGQGFLVVEHRAEIAHVEPAFMRTEIEPCQSDGHGDQDSWCAALTPLLMVP
jgi:hypothetical protein